jgi:hypothetical protein
MIFQIFQRGVTKLGYIVEIRWFDGMIYVLCYKQGCGAGTGTGRNRIHLGTLEPEPEPYSEYDSGSGSEYKKWSKQLKKIN